MRRHSLVRASATFVFLLAAGHASAAGLTKNQCIDAAEEGQALRDKGKMTEARTRFSTCASSDCPNVVAKECGSWLSDLDARIPTVLLSAVDAQGGDLVDVKVTLDGKPLADRLGGTQIQIDPGPHRFKFEYKTGTPIEETVVIQERTKGRPIQAKFADVNAPQAAPRGGGEPTRAKDEPQAKSSPPIAAFVVGGIGIAALGVGGYFGITGYSQFNDLKGRGCSPHCPKAETDEVSQKFLIADIGIGVGVVGLAVATYLFLTHNKQPTQVQIGKNFSVTPSRNGGWFAGYESRF